MQNSDQNSKLIIFGAGNFALLACHLFETDSDYTVSAYCVDNQYFTDKELNGIPIINVDDLIENYDPKEYKVFVALGISNLNQLREQKCNFIEQAGFQLAHFVSSSAIVPESMTIEPNTMIMEYVVIQPFCKIGKNCIIWNFTAIALKSIIDDNCWIVKATLGEQVSLGRNTFVGLEALIVPKLNVGKFSLLGARSITIRDLDEYSVLGAGEKKVSKVNSRRMANRLK